MIIFLYYTLIKNKKFIKERSKRGERTMRKNNRDIIEKKSREI